MEHLFEGEVVIGDEFRGRGNGPSGFIHIGGEDILLFFDDNEIEEPVTIVINDGERVIHGEPDYTVGYCSDRWDPIMSDRLDINNTDLLAVLQFHAGEYVKVLVTHHAPEYLKE